MKDQKLEESLRLAEGLATESLSYSGRSLLAERVPELVAEIRGLTKQRDDARWVAGSMASSMDCWLKTLCPNSMMAEKTAHEHLWVDMTYLWGEDSRMLNYEEKYLLAYAEAEKWATEEIQ